MSASTEGGTAGRRPFIAVNRVTRRFCTTMLALEAVVLVCAAPVARAIAGVPLATAWGVGGGLAVLAFVLCGLLRYRWAYYAASAFQAVVLLCGFVVTTMFFLGAVFIALWIAAIWCGHVAHPHER